MKGIIFNLLEDFIIATYGEEEYEQIIHATDTGPLDPFQIVGPGSYSDDAFNAILKKTTEMVERSIPEILKDMGRHSLPKLAERYPHFFDIYEHPRDFLKTAAMIHHVEVKKLYHDAEVPNFFIEDRDQDGLVLTYTSNRHLCNLVEGLITGLGDHYKISLSIEQIECTRSGAHACKFLIQFHEEEGI